MENTKNNTKNTIAPNRLMIYHTTDCDPNYYWENNEVATKLKKGLITSYEEYKIACRTAGSICYNKTVYTEYVNYVKQLKDK
jgi:hypothetical protein